MGAKATLPPMTLEQLDEQLDKDPYWLFENDAKAAFRLLSKICHPDTAGVKGEPVFRKLNAAYKALTEPITIKSPSRTYEVFKAQGVSGDIATLYPSDKFIVKIAKKEKANTFLQNEVEVLKSLDLDNAGIFGKLIYSVEESFLIRSKNLPVRRCNVFRYDSELVSLVDLKRKLGFVPGRHVAWIFKRLLMALVHAHDRGVVHAGVHPEHFLIRPSDHGGVLVDWTQSVKVFGDLKLRNKRFRHFYPPEETGLRSNFDLFMAAKTAQWLLGGSGNVDAPPLMRQYFDGIALSWVSARPDSALILHEEFDELLLKLYGKPTFVELNI